MWEHGRSAADPYRGRTPTSHERMAGVPWDASYGDGPAPWEIGHPQPAIARLVARVPLDAPVLDVGCGSGENTLLIASPGVAILGVDVAETAVAMTREKAAGRGIDAEFAVADALHLEHLGWTFTSVVDSALFHTFDEPERVETRFHGAAGAPAWLAAMRRCHA